MVRYIHSIPSLETLTSFRSAGVQCHRAADFSCISRRVMRQQTTKGFRGCAPRVGYQRVSASEPTDEDTLPGWQEQWLTVGLPTHRDHLWLYLQKNPPLPTNKTENSRTNTAGPGEVASRPTLEKVLPATIWPAGLYGLTDGIFEYPRQ